MRYISIAELLSKEKRKEFEGFLKYFARIDLPVQTAYFFRLAAEIHHVQLFWETLSAESKWFIRGCLYERGCLRVGKIYVPFEEVQPLLQQFLEPGFNTLKAKHESTSLISKARYDDDGMHATVLVVPIVTDAKIYFIKPKVMPVHYIPLVAASATIGGRDIAIWMVDYVRMLEQGDLPRLEFCPQRGHGC
jgi:hypothetical protein